MRKTLCSALIQPHFDYASSAWFTSLSKNLSSKLQVLQNKMVRFIDNAGPRSHVGCDQLKVHGMLNVVSRAKQLRLNQVHNIFHDKAPSYLSKNFIRISDQHCHNTRKSNYNFFKIGTNAIKSFFYIAISDWNKLNANVKCVEDRARFKKDCKKELMSIMVSLETNDFFYY